MTIEHKEESYRTAVETILVIIGVVLFLIYLVVSSGCAAHGTLVSGERVAVPQQWVEYCARHPEREECAP